MCKTVHVIRNGTRIVIKLALSCIKIFIILRYIICTLVSLVCTQTHIISLATIHPRLYTIFTYSSPPSPFHLILLFMESSP
jgi:hypothetical protein